MKQPQFEDLLFSEKALSAEEQDQLDEYLRLDESNAQLARSWQQVDSLMQEVEIIWPEAGFSARWLEVEQADRRKRERLQAFWAILISALSSFAIVYFAAGSARSLITNTTSVVYGAFRQLLEFGAFLQIMTRLMVSILNKFPPSWWASIAASILLLPSLWYVIYRELAATKGVQS